MKAPITLLEAPEPRLWFRILFLADSVQIRALMCATSFGWAGYLLAMPASIDRPYYAEMRSFGPAWLWALAFLAHAVGALWRIRDTRERVAAALLINGWGVAVWTLNCYSQIVGAGHWVPSATIDVGSTLMLFCAFVSSGWNRSSTST